MAFNSPITNRLSKGISGGGIQRVPRAPGLTKGILGKGIQVVGRNPAGISKGVPGMSAGVQTVPRNPAGISKGIPAEGLQTIPRVGDPTGAPLTPTGTTVGAKPVGQPGSSPTPASGGAGTSSTLPLLDAQGQLNVAGYNAKQNADIAALGQANTDAGTKLQSNLDVLAHNLSLNNLGLLQRSNRSGALYSSVLDQNRGNLYDAYRGNVQGQQLGYGELTGRNATRIAGDRQSMDQYLRLQQLLSTEREQKNLPGAPPVDGAGGASPPSGGGATTGTTATAGPAEGLTKGIPGSLTTVPRTGNPTGGKPGLTKGIAGNLTAVERKGNPTGKLAKSLAVKKGEPGNLTTVKRGKK